MIQTLAAEVVIGVAAFLVGWLARGHSHNVFVTPEPVRPDPELAEVNAFIASMKDDTQDNIRYQEPKAIAAAPWPTTSHSMQRMRVWMDQHGPKAKHTLPLAIEGRRKD